MRVGGDEGVDTRSLDVHDVEMSNSEAARHDLYTGLAELLGSQRAETLMTHLPRYDAVDVATKSDIAVLKSDIAVLKSDIAVLKADITELRTEVKADITELRRDMGKRLDRLFLALLTGLFVVVAAMAGVVFTTL